MQPQTTKKSVLVKLSTQGVYFNETQFISYADTNLPHESFTVSARNSTYWLADMVSFRDRVLQVEIAKYSLSGVEEQFRQQSAKRAFTELHFLGMDVAQLKAICTTYKHAGLKGLAAPIREVPKSSLASLSFSVSVKRLRFEAGRVVFTKRMKWQPEPVDFAIANSHILPEFGFVQQFISKQLGTSKINVHITIRSTGSAKAIYSCTSPEIDTIGPDFFQVLKFKKVAQVRRSIFKGETDQELLDLNGYLRDMGDESLHKLGLSGSDIIESILRKEGIRNKQHIDYLANKLHRTGVPIYITLTPSFGFLFSVEGEEKVHYLWEMLNSNATYVWSFGRGVPVEQQLKKVTDLVSYIRVQGRAAYLQEADLDRETDFTRVYHSKVNSHVRDHFPYWKFKIEEVLY